jgi:hypothetical protein
MIMIKRVLGAVLTTALIAGSVGLAQAPPQAPPTAPAKPPTVEKPLIPLKVQVTISRYEGEKKTSSLPFALWVNANYPDRTTLTVGIDVPVRSPTVNVGNGPVTTVPSVSYRSVGTTLYCTATAMDDGRFKVDLGIQDSSVTPGKDTAASPTFQSLSAHNVLLLRDGQNAQFVAATDKVSGEVTKIDVTITVLK